MEPEITIDDVSESLEEKPAIREQKPRKIAVFNITNVSPVSEREYDESNECARESIFGDRTYSPARYNEARLELRIERAKDIAGNFNLEPGNVTKDCVIKALKLDLNDDEKTFDSLTPVQILKALGGKTKTDIALERTAAEFGAAFGALLETTATTAGATSEIAGHCISYAGKKCASAVYTGMQATGRAAANSAKYAARTGFNATKAVAGYTGQTAKKVYAGLFKDIRKRSETIRAVNALAKGWLALTATKQSESDGLAESVCKEPDYTCFYTKPETKTEILAKEHLGKQESKLEETISRAATAMNAVHIEEDVEYKDRQCFFKALPYDNCSIDVKLDPEPIKQNGSIKYATVLEWWQHRQDTGQVLLDIQMVYQMGRRLMHLEQTKEVKKCAETLNEIFKYCMCGQVKINCKSGLEAEIERRDINGKSCKEQMQIPEFTVYDYYFSYLVLAKRQSKDKLGTVEFIPENAKPLLKALFGKNYEEAGAVFQYLTPPHNNDELKEVRLWVPTKNNRTTERVVVFDVYGDYAGNIVSSNWPARGVVVVGQKN